MIWDTITEIKDSLNLNAPFLTTWFKIWDACEKQLAEFEITTTYFNSEMKEFVSKECRKTVECPVTVPELWRKFIEILNNLQYKWKHSDMYRLLTDLELFKKEAMVSVDILAADELTDSAYVY